MNELTEKRLHVNQDFIVRTSTASTVTLWNAEAGLELELGRPSYALLLKFVFPRRVADVLDELGILGSSAQEKLLHGLEEMSSSRLLLESGTGLRKSADLGTRGLFGASSIPVSQAVSDPRISAVIIGVEYDAGASGKGGSRLAPDSLRQVSGSLFVEELDHGMYDVASGRRILAGKRLADVGNLGDQVQMRNGPVLDQLAEVARIVVQAEKLFVAIGGDHSITHSIIRGYEKAGITDIGILHFDAHCDYVRAETGNWRVSLHHGNVMSWVAGMDNVKQINQIGIRQLVSEEPVDEPKVQMWPGRSAIATPTEELLQEFPVGLKWHLSIDVDVLDPSVMPSTGTPVPGGYSLFELNELIERIGRGLDIIGIDIVELIGASSDHSSLVAADALLRTIDVSLSPRPVFSR